jgi:hypothetical protein
LELIFMGEVESIFTHLHIDIKFSQNHLLKSWFSFHCVFLTSFLKIKWSQIYTYFGAHCTLLLDDKSVFMTVPYFFDH